MKFQNYLDLTENFHRNLMCCRKFVKIFFLEIARKTFVFDFLPSNTPLKKLRTETFQKLEHILTFLFFCFNRAKVLILKRIVMHARRPSFRWNKSKQKRSFGIKIVSAVRSAASNLSKDRKVFDAKHCC